MGSELVLHSKVKLDDSGTRLKPAFFPGENSTTGGAACLVPQYADVECAQVGK